MFLGDFAVFQIGGAFGEWLGCFGNRAIGKEIDQVLTMFMGAQSGSRKRNRGFTLIEVLTAFMVLSVGTTVFIGLYRGSLSLSKTSQLNQLSALVAEEALVNLQDNAEGFVWPNFDDVALNTYESVRPVNGSDGVNIPEYPSVMPNNERFFRQARAQYQNFSWEGFARLPSSDANYVEILVVVQWTFDGRPQQYYLTSAVPRSVGEGIGS